MDQNLIDFVDAAKTVTAGNETRTNLKIDRDGTVELDTPNGPRKITLKPMVELFGHGNNADVDPESHTFMPLFMAIEGAIVNHCHYKPSVNVAKVASTLDRMGLKPETDPGPDELAFTIQMELRLVLSLNNFSRQEVRTAIRRISRSVVRHTQIEGPQGYLRFINKYMPS